MSQTVAVVNAMCALRKRLGGGSSPMQRRYGDVNMKILPTALIGQGKNTRVVMAALLTAGAIGGWALSAMLTPGAAAFDGFSRLDLSRKSDIQSFDEPKPSLVGSYVVS